MSAYNKGAVLAYGEACVGAGKAAASIVATPGTVYEADRDIEIAARLLGVIHEMGAVDAIVQTDGPLDRDATLRLALTLAADALKESEATLERTRQAFDHDEIAVSFSIEHDPHCPFARDRGSCVCGVHDMHNDLREAVAEVARIRAELVRLASEVADA